MFIEILEWKIWWDKKEKRWNHKFIHLFDSTPFPQQFVFHFQEGAFWFLKPALQLFLTSVKPLFWANFLLIKIYTLDLIWTKKIQGGDLHFLDQNSQKNTIVATTIMCMPKIHLPKLSTITYSKPSSCFTLMEPGMRAEWSSVCLPKTQAEKNIIWAATRQYFIHMSD